MRISEEQYCELIDEVVDEGDPVLSIAPLLGAPAEAPAEWRPLLTTDDPRAAIALLWQPLADRVPRVYRALQERLHGIGFLRTDETPASLVYFFSDGDEWIPFRGRSPVANDVLLAKPMPDEFLDFYRVHDGWVHYYSDDSGPAPSRSWAPLSDMWTDVTWRLPPGDISEGTVLAVYRDSDELAFVYDTSRPVALPLRCTGDGIVDVLLDMWTAIDSEMGAFLEDLSLIGEQGPSISAWLVDIGRQAIARYERVLARIPERQVFAAHLGGGGIHDQACDIFLTAHYSNDTGRIDGTKSKSAIDRR